MEYGEEVQKPIKELGLVIDPDTIRHAKRLKYKFGFDRENKDKAKDEEVREWNLYGKIIEGLAVEFNEDGGRSGNGWAWPDLYIDKDKTIEAHFTIQMHKKGTFMIPTRRDMNLSEFIREFILVFIRFLSKDEIRFLLEKVGIDAEGGEYLHLANRLYPDEIVEAKLNKAKLKVELVDLHGDWEAKVYVDKSRNYEIESEGWTPENENLNSILTNTLTAVGTFRDIEHRQKSIDRGMSLVLGGQTRNVQEIQANGQQLQIVQQQNRDIYNDVISELALQQNQLHSIEDINYEQLDYLRHLKTRNKLIHKDIGLTNDNIVILGKMQQNTGQLLHLKFEEFEEFTKEENDLLVDGINHGLDKFKKDLHTKLDNVKEDISKDISQSEGNIIDHFNKIFNSFRTDYVNNLYLILRAVQKVPNLTTKELIKTLKSELNVSKRTIYKYFKQLREKGLLEARDVKLTNGPGGPSKLYNLSQKAREMLSNLLNTIK